MTRAGTRIVGALLRALEPPEREVVAGDLQELGLPGPRAIREVLGLVIRRRLAAWREPRAWLALALVALPLAMLLSLLSRHSATSAAFAAWFYVDNWTPAYLASPAARGDLFFALRLAVVECAALAIWSWTAGGALALLSPRTARVTLALFTIAVFGGTAGTTTLAGRNAANAAIFSLALYRVWLPFAFRVAFVMVPAYCGGRRAAREPAIGVSAGVAIAAAVCALTALMHNAPRMAVSLGWWSLSADRPVLGPIWLVAPPWPLRVLPLALIVPALGILSHSVWHAWRRRPAQAMVS